MYELRVTFDVIAAAVAFLFAVGVLLPSQPNWRTPSGAVTNAVAATTLLYLSIRVLPIWGAV